MPYIDDLDSMDFSKPPAGKVTLSLTFQCEEEEKEYITENLRRLVLSRLEQWPSSVWDERIDIEWQKD